jgi:hypothetical protein
VLFETRWALSYLRGPLTLTEIAQLTPHPASASREPADVTTGAATAGPLSVAAASSAAAGQRTQTGPSKPLVPAGVTERYLVRQPGSPLQPHAAARVRVHFVDAKTDVDNWRTSYYLAPITDTGVDWAAADVHDSAPVYVAQPVDASYAPVPATVLAAKACAAWPGQLSDHVYRSAALELLKCAALGASGAAGISESEFRAQLAQRLRERRDAAVADLRAKYAKRVASLDERLRKAEQKVAREQSEASSQTTASALAIGGSLLGALFGGRRGAAGKTASAVRSAGRITKERADVGRAQADAEAVQQQAAAIDAELNDEIARLDSSLAPDSIAIERVAIRPRKADTTVDDVAVVWVG